MGPSAGQIPDMIRACCFIWASCGFPRRTAECFKPTKAEFIEFIEFMRKSVLQRKAAASRHLLLIHNNSSLNFKLLVKNCQFTPRRLEETANRNSSFYYYCYYYYSRRQSTAAQPTAGQSVVVVSHSMLTASLWMEFIRVSVTLMAIMSLISRFVVKSASSNPLCSPGRGR